MNGTHSNDYSIIHFNSCQYSKKALEQNVSKFCMDSIIRQTSVPSAVYVPAVGHMTDMLHMHCIEPTHYKAQYAKTFSH